MDKARYTAIAADISKELEELAKRYDLSNFSFIGFVGEPGKGHVPICMQVITKPQFNEHAHIILSKAVFIQACQSLGMTGGAIHKVEI